jgi:hypothetical protein
VPDKFVFNLESIEIMEERVDENVINDNNVKLTNNLQLSFSSILDRELFSIIVHVYYTVDKEIAASLKVVNNYEVKGLKMHLKSKKDEGAIITNRGFLNLLVDSSLAQTRGIQALKFGIYKQLALIPFITAEKILSSKNKVEAEQP